MEGDGIVGIGASPPRKEIWRLLRENGCDSDEVNLKDQLHAVLVRSPHAHARIRSIDTDAPAEFGIDHLDMPTTSEPVSRAMQGNN